MTELISELQRERVYRLAAGGTRSDGRTPEEVRPLTIEKNYIKNAEGSARIKLGNTDVLVGVKVELGVPYPDTPDSGVLSTGAELIPMASPIFESGPPRPDAIELARVVDRGIREAHTIDFKALCVTPKEKVWICFVDMHVLDYDGNLFDAASYGAMSALTCTKVPASKIGKEDYPLPIQHYPISVTAAKIRDIIVIDPNLQEEQIADARLTIATDENGDIRAMQKGLRGSFSYEEISRVIGLALKASEVIRTKIKA
jgi:exosome complex component RRP42